MLVDEVYPRLFQVKMNTQYELCMTFIRIQEFYESPYKEIQGQSFDLEKYMDVYAEERGNFTYTLDWAGFNVPGYIFFEFLGKNSDLRKKEVQLFKKCVSQAMYEYEKDFYVIGIYKKYTMQHECAHALFYLNDDYRKEIIHVLSLFPISLLGDMMTSLQSKGYCEKVMLDEVQAYSLDFCDRPEFASSFTSYKYKEEDQKHFTEIKKIFNKYWSRQ